MRIISGTASGVSHLTKLKVALSKKAKQRLKWLDYYNSHGHNAPHLPLLWEVHRPSIGGRDATISNLTTLEDEASVEEIGRAYQELKKAEKEVE